VSSPRSSSRPLDRGLRELVDPPAHQRSPIDDRREIPGVPVQGRVLQIEVQHVARPIPGDLARVHLDHLRLITPARHPQRPAHEAADSIGPHQRTRPQLPEAPAHAHAPRVALHPRHARPFAHRDPPRARRHRERMIELDPPHHPPDPLDRLWIAALERPRRGPHREPGDARRGHLHAHPDRREQPIRARPDRARADLLPRIVLLLEHDDPLAQRWIGRAEEQRRGDPRGAAADDDEIDIHDRGA
jgi:hypothetical protein